MANWEKVEKRSHATLRIFSRVLTSTYIAEALNQRPSLSHELGDRVYAPDPHSPLRKEAFWLLDSNVERTEPIGAHIDVLVSFVEAHRDSIEQLRPSCQIDIRASFISGSGQGTLVFAPELLQRLGRVNLPLIVDV